MGYSLNSLKGGDLTFFNQLRRLASGDAAYLSSRMFRGSCGWQTSYCKNQKGVIHGIKPATIIGVIRGLDYISYSQRVHVGIWDILGP